MSDSYRLKISLVEPFYPIIHLHRVVEISRQMTFEGLCRYIGSIFQFETQQMWQFFISRHKMDSLDKLQHTKVLDSATQLVVGDVFLEEKQYFYLHCASYLFRIRVEKINHQPENNLPILVKHVGSLPQNPHQVAHACNATRIMMTDTQMKFELSLIAALMLIVGDTQNPTRWQDLQEVGIADELVKRNLIKPCVNPMHKVRLTSFGESELARFMEMSGMMKDR